MEIKFERATIDDAEALINVRNQSFYSDYVKYGKFPNATVWSLQTPADKKRNHYFYKKMGYTIIKEYMEGSVKIVFFEKKINSVK